MINAKRETKGYLNSRQSFHKSKFPSPHFQTRLPHHWTSMPSFELPQLQSDADDLFGPSAQNKPAKFRDIPFQTYSKSERLGNIVDWSSTLLSSSAAASTSNSYASRRLRTTNGLDAGESGLYGYRNQEDEASFSLVDSGGRLARAGGRNAGSSGGLGPLGRNTGYGRGRGGNSRFGSQANGRGGAAGGGRGGYQARGGLAASRRGFGGARGGWGSRFDFRDGRNNTSRESSVQVGDKWMLLEEIEFSRLAKLRLDVETEEVETISQHGFLYEYDRTYDRVSTKSEKPLQHMERLHYNPTASDDPILQSFASSDRAKVYTTDSILSMIMCAQRSVYPWDIVLTREGDKLWMDKREGGPLDYLSVNENASDPPMELNVSQIDLNANPAAAFNTPSALSQQATFLNENFAWQVVKESQESKLDFEHPNPFYDPDENEPLASCGYRYRQFDLSLAEEEDISVIVRTEVDALLRGTVTATGASNTATDEETFITLKTLFEFDSRAQGSGGAPDWRAKLDSQRGAVVATEMKNNSLKLARWATSSVLAGAGAMKIG